MRHRARSAYATSASYTPQPDGGRGGIESSYIGRLCCRRRYGSLDQSKESVVTCPRFELAVRRIWAARGRGSGNLRLAGLSRLNVKISVDFRKLPIPPRFVVCVESAHAAGTASHALADEFSQRVGVVGAGQRSAALWRAGSSAVGWVRGGTLYRRPVACRGS